TVPSLVNVRVTSIRRFAVQPRILVTGMYDGDVAQNPYHYIHRLGMRARVWIGDALEECLAVQQNAIWGGDVESFRKNLGIPAYIRFQCGPYVVSIQIQ